MNIVIIGAGIAGLSSAIALKQIGFDVTLYERRSAPANIGAGMVCWPNASFVLQALGILDEVAHKAGKIAKMQRFDQQNNLLTQLDIDALDQSMRYPSYALTRSDLIDILLNKARSLAIDIHFNQPVKAILSEQGHQTARIQLENNHEITANLIIGADGRMNSKARQYVVGHSQSKYQPKFQHFINWIGVFNAEKDSTRQTDNIQFTELSVLDYWGQNERFGIVPINETTAYWAAGIYADTIGNIDPSNYHHELLSLFSSWPRPIKQLIENTAINKINKLYIHDHDPLQKWYKKNVLLIGDAAHAALPTSGQGACQALEDAWHLANILSKNNTNLTEAFSQFQQLRQQKTDNIIHSGRQLANTIFATKNENLTTRNAAIQATNPQQTIQGMAQFWAQGLPL